MIGFRSAPLKVCRLSQKVLVVSEKLDSHPAPEVEEDVDGDGDGQQQAVEAHAAAAAAAAFGEVLVHRSRVEQPEERHDRDEPHHGGQRQHDGGQLGDVRQHRCRTQDLPGDSAEASTPALVQLMCLSLSATISPLEGSCSECHQ